MTKTTSKEKENTEDMKNSGKTADATPEAAAETAAAQAEEAPVVEVVSELELALMKQEEYKSILQRLQAEFENYKKRTVSDSKRARIDGQDDVIFAMLPLADSFDLAISALSEQADEGFKLIYKQLKSLFEKYSVTEIEAKAGDDFNPEFHDAVLNEESPEGKGKIITVLMKGYRRENRILRHTMVKVGI